MPTLPTDPDIAYRLEQSVRSRHKLERLREVLTTPGHFGTGASPHVVVHEDNKLRLLRLVDDSGQPRTGPAVLFVSAPVSRYFVLDLLPGRSFVGHVGDAGFDVFLIDFGEPDQADRFADLDYYVNGLIRRCVRRITTLTGDSAPSVIGYCLGGTLALLYTALYPESVSRLALLTTTIDGDVKGGIRWTAHCLGLPGESYDNPRLVPATDIKSWFEMLTPGSSSVIGRTNDLWQRLDQPVERLRDIRTMATWVDDVCPPPAACWPSCPGNSDPAATDSSTAPPGRRPTHRPRPADDARPVGIRRKRHHRPAGRCGRDHPGRTARRDRPPARWARRHRRRQDSKALWDTTIDFLRSPAPSSIGSP